MKVGRSFLSAYNEIGPAAIRTLVFRGEFSYHAHSARPPKGGPLYRLIFWIDILTLASMIASFLLGIKAYAKTRERWLGNLLIYLASYTAWVLLTGFLFFETAYLAEPVPTATLAVAVLRAFAPLVVLYAGPLFALRIARIEIGRRVLWLLSLPVAFVFGTLLVYYASGSPKVAVVPNTIFNLYIGGLFLLAALKTRHNAGAPGDDPMRRALTPFLWYSAAGYGALLAVNILATALPALSREPLLTVIAAGAFCLFGALLTVRIFLAMHGLPAIQAVVEIQPSGLPEEFVDSFTLTGREREIASDLEAGMRSEEIAARRSISTRTVESHIRNIYRKCDVDDRGELLRLLERYRS